MAYPAGRSIRWPEWLEAGGETIARKARDRLKAFDGDGGPSPSRAFLVAAGLMSDLDRRSGVAESRCALLARVRDVRKSPGLGIHDPQFGRTGCRTRRRSSCRRPSASYLGDLREACAGFGDRMTDRDTLQRAVCRSLWVISSLLRNGAGDRCSACSSHLPMKSPGEERVAGGGSSAAWIAAAAAVAEDLGPFSP